MSAGSTGQIAVLDYGIGNLGSAHKALLHLGAPARLVQDADEVDGALRLIKGGGGALLGEKIVASASKRMIVIADVSKYVDRLGVFPLAVEIVPFGLAATRRQITAEQSPQVRGSVTSAAHLGQ